jgi:hypothetical protein
MKNITHRIIEHKDTLGSSRCLCAKKKKGKKTEGKNSTLQTAVMILVDYFFYTLTGKHQL